MYRCAMIDRIEMTTSMSLREWIRQKYEQSKEETEYFRRILSELERIELAELERVEQREHPER